MESTLHGMCSEGVYAYLQNHGHDENEGSEIWPTSWNSKSFSKHQRCGIQPSFDVLTPPQDKPLEQTSCCTMQVWWAAEKYTGVDDDDDDDDDDSDDRDW